MRLWILAFSLLISACSGGKAPIKIGLVLPLTGTFAVYGQQALRGAELAVDQINAEGGILGHDIQLIVRDNSTDPGKTVKHSRDLIIQEEVFALMGPVSSSSRYAMSEVSEEFSVPMFYGIDYEGRHFSPYLICYSTIPEHYIEPVIPYLKENSGEKFYVFGYDYIWPHRMSERLLQSVESVGGEVIGVEFTAFGVESYNDVLSRINQSGADNLMLILPGGDGFNFLSQMANYKFDKPVKVVAFAADETYLSNLSKATLEGVMTALHFFSSVDSQVGQQFVEDYRTLHGNEVVVTYSSKAHYDLIKLVKVAIEKAGVVDREQMLNAMKNLSLYDGESEVTLREDHHFNLPMYLAKFENGELNVIEKFGIIKPRDQRNFGNE
ncbi:substrate-binding protein [Vibrio sonorensis]|uniref:substrate-binding protein n=1 Tax=Vibrio sonorensis TaxID=1004316 RepID=UPI001FE0AA14|nr:substrate-binding protein [Vibrio sonorensis]